MILRVNQYLSQTSWNSQNIANYFLKNYYRFTLKNYAIWEHTSSEKALTSQATNTSSLELLHMEVLDRRQRMWPCSLVSPGPDTQRRPLLMHQFCSLANRNALALLSHQPKRKVN